MTKAELMKLVGKEVTVFFKDKSVGVSGVLNYADEFSAKHDYVKPNYFYIGNTSFRVSHIRTVKVPILYRLEMKGENK